jgi:tryptophan synthase beta chain
LTENLGNTEDAFVPEVLMAAIGELEEAYAQAKQDPSFCKELAYYLAEYAGRPTPLYYAENLTRKSAEQRFT